MDSTAATLSARIDVDNQRDPSPHERHGSLRSNDERIVLYTVGADPDLGAPAITSDASQERSVIFQQLQKLHHILLGHQAGAHCGANPFASGRDRLRPIRSVVSALQRLTLGSTPAIAGTPCPARSHSQGTGNHLRINRGMPKAEVNHKFVGSGPVAIHCALSVGHSTGVSAK